MSKLFYVALAGLVILPILTWRQFIRNYRLMRKDYQDALLFHKRHNCVVMYSNNRGMSGWPPYEKRVLFNMNNLNISLEPYIYFISSATRSLDVAMMLLGAPSIADALIKARNRGVDVRLMINCDHRLNSNRFIANFHKQGIKIAFFISRTTDVDSLMHYKYMVKDYSESSGFVCMGSANLSSQDTFLNNYEDVVFTTDRVVVEAFHQNFAKCWRDIQIANEDEFNKHVLQKFSFLKT